MGAVVDLVDKIKRYYKFTSYEARGLAIAILAIAFIISFKDWGTTSFNLGEGLFNFFNAVLIVALSLLINDAAKRIWGLAIGYRIEFKMWTFGLIAAVALAFVSNGRLWLIVPGGFLIHHLAGHRLGFFRYGLNYFAQAMIALSGPLFTLMLVMFLKVMYAFSPNPLIQKAIIFNIIFAITSLLPVPPLDGSKIFFGSRMLYAFVLPALIVAFVLMIVNIPIFFSLVISLLIGVVLWILYYISFERKAWIGPK